MKTKNLLLALLLLAGFTGFGQQVPREQVIVEIGTGTW